MQRDTFNENTVDPVTGLAFLEQYADLINALFDNSVLPLTSVSGTNTVTADVDPELPVGGLVAGMKFAITWPADNTAAVTLDIGGAGAVSVVDAKGDALTAGTVAGGSRAVLEYLDGKLYILNAVSAAAGGGGGGVTRTIYDASAVWTNDVSADALVMVELWGAGGGGTGSTGGGGGSYARQIFKASDLGASETMTVPAGASAGAAGGSCTFGTHLTAYGGDEAGGGELEAASGTTPGAVGGGSPGQDAQTIFGGGGGNGVSNFGGNAVYGGGGGAELGGTTYNGKSIYGGDGGGGGVAGERPGGGGGKYAAGGGGRCIITVFGG